MKNYCVYLTTYSGDKLPPFYIGSSSVERVNNGYKGSVKSKKYKHIWDKELKENPDLFKAEILSTWKTREEALIEELRLQKENNVVKSENYINMSFATVNGYFGRDVSGENNPLFGQNKSNNINIRTAAQNQSVERLGKTKYNCDRLMKISIAKSGRTTKNDISVFIATEKKNKLPKDIRIKIVEMRNAGLLFNEIFKYVLSLGYEITQNSIPRICRREENNKLTNKQLREQKRKIQGDILSEIVNLKLQGLSFTKIQKILKDDFHLEFSYRTIITSFNRYIGNGEMHGSL